MCYCPIVFGLVLKDAPPETVSRTALSLALRRICDPGQHFPQSIFLGYFVRKVPELGKRVFGSYLRCLSSHSLQVKTG